MAGHGSGDSTGQGLLPGDCLNEATLFWEKENLAIWTWDMLCLLALGRENHPWPVLLAIIDVAWASLWSDSCSFLSLLKHIKNT